MSEGNSFDGRDPKLKRWLEGTNWPEYFEYEHVLKMVEGVPVDELTVKKGIDKVAVFINTKRLTRSDFDYVINSLIKNIEHSSETTLRYNAGKEALKK